MLPRISDFFIFGVYHDKTFGGGDFPAGEGVAVPVFPAVDGRQPLLLFIFAKV
jgi:hypothetical protein